MRKLAASAALAALIAGPAAATGLQIEVEGEANGMITIDLLDDVAPAHVKQIATLAAEGQYDGVVFHRVIDGFMAQTGDVENGRLGADLRRAGTGGSNLPDLRPNSRMCLLKRAWLAWHGRKAPTRPTASFSSCSTQHPS